MPPNGHTDGTATSTAQQLLVVALCAVGLLVAAAAMPATAPGLSLSDSPESDCEILLSEEPVAGHTIGVTIRYDGEPVVDSPVWFNGDFVDRTDENGRAAATVPYERQLRIQVALPNGGRCRGGTATSGGVAAPASVAQSMAAIAGTGVTNVAPAQAQQASENGSSNYPVRGQIDIAVARHPYPGEPTTIRATIQGNPVADATVSVDREQVGRTDENGEATITAPEDGDGTLRVRVERGDFTSVRNVVVLRLSGEIRPGSLLPVPGQDAIVAAQLGDRPAENATVTVGGERVGRTGADGTLDTTLPADPTAQVTISTADQSTSFSVFSAFAPTILLGFLFVVVTFGIPTLGSVTSGRRGFAVGCLVVASSYVLGALSLVLHLVFGLALVPLLAMSAATIGVSFFGYVLYGRRGLVISSIFMGIVNNLLVVYLVVGPATIRTLIAGNLALIASVAVGALLLSGAVLFSRSEYSLAESATATAGLVQRFLQRLYLSTFAVAGRLERWVDRFEARVDTMSIETVRQWIVGLPAGLVGLVVALLTAPGRLLSGGLGDAVSNDSDRGAADASADGTLSPRAQFRRTWRQFASRVVPTEWPHRTAGEISRRAIARGMAAKPVEQLTETFRAVEYGDETLTERQVERAAAALSALDEDDDEEGST